MAGSGSVKAAQVCASCPNSASNAVIVVEPGPSVSGKTQVMLPKDTTPVASAPPNTSVPSAAATVPPAPLVLSPQMTPVSPPIAQPAVPGVSKIVDPTRDFRDRATGAIRFDHARDYTWVVGQLQYLHGKRQWRVRYSPCDVDDDFGGLVTITGMEHMEDQFKEGAAVRIQGQLIDSDGHKAAPEYHVYDIRVLE